MQSEDDDTSTTADLYSHNPNNVPESHDNKVIDEYAQLESLPLRAVQKIVKYIRSLDQRSARYANKERVFQELYRVLGSDFMTLAARVREMSRRMAVNEKMDFKYSDIPEPVVLAQVSEDEKKNREDKHIATPDLSDEELLDMYRQELNQPQYDVDDLAISGESGDTKTIVKGKRRFNQSYSQYMSQLRSQRRVMELFKGKSTGVDPGDFEFPTPVRLIYDEEKPSFKDIESYRGDRDPELTESDRALQQAFSYMQKYIDYFRHIQNIRDVRQIPSKTERILMLEHFGKYLADARYYLKFYQQYSHYWAPQATRTIVPYKGMYVPLEKRKEEETYHFGDPINEFKPLRRIIYQDFHNKVRQGLPPSFDLDGRLPTLAMYYARTTFVPPMTNEEMQMLFYPDRILDRNEKPYLNQMKRAMAIGRKPVVDTNEGYFNELNVFQALYLSRYHLYQHLNRPLCSNYNNANERYSTFSGEQFLNHLNSTSRELLQHATGEYILLLCMALILGIPFVTLHINTDEDSLDAALGRISEYCNCAMICTFDEQIISFLSQGSSSTICKNLEVQHILYYGNQEPRAVVRSFRGSSCLDDPVSNILKPTKEILAEQSYKNSALWEYLPMGVTTTFLVHQYKQSIASTKGVSSTTLENCKSSSLQRVAKWRRAQEFSDPPIHIFSHSQVSAPRSMTMSNFSAVCKTVEQSLSPLLGELRSAAIPIGCLGQILIMLPVDHPMFHFWILFCIRNSFSFSLLSVSQMSDERTTRNHLSQINPIVVVADTHTIVSLIPHLSTENIRAKSDRPSQVNVLDNTDITKLNMNFRGLLSDESNTEYKMGHWIKSSFLKSVQRGLSSRIEKDAPTDGIIGFISIGYNIFPETSSQQLKSMKARTPYLYHMVPSNSCFGPVVCTDVFNFSSPSSYSPSGEVEIGDQIAGINSHKVQLSGPIPYPCIPKSEKQLYHLSQYEALEGMLASVFNSETLKDDDARVITSLKRLFNKMDMPDECRHSFSTFLEMKREFTFYYLVLILLAQRKASSATEDISLGAISPLEHALFGALIDELDSVISQEYWPQIQYSDIEKFLKLRMDLTRESLKLQILDFRTRFNQAKRSGQVMINTHVDQEGPQLIRHDNMTNELEELVSFGTASVLDHQTLLVPRKNVLIMSNGALLNCSLMETLYESEANGLIHRSYLSRKERMPNKLQMVVVQTRYANERRTLQTQWLDICLRVKLRYESIVMHRKNKQATSKWIWPILVSKSTSVETLSSQQEKLQAILELPSTQQVHVVVDPSSLLLYDYDMEFNVRDMELLFDSILSSKAIHLLSRL